MNQEKINDIRHLEVCLKFTLHAIDNDGTEMDDLFQAQAKKLQKQLDNIK